MRCPLCGGEIPSGARFCPRCGWSAQGNGKRSTVKTSEIVIVVVLISAVILLAAVAYSMFVDRKNDATESDKKNPAIETQEVVENPTDKGEELYTEETEKKDYVESQPQPQQKPEPVPAPKTDTTAKYAKKDEFLQTASDIEWYSENYMDTAETQYEINVETAAVYKKWDTLLNDVYQYLKKTMPSAEFKKLQNDELRWIKEKDAAIEAAGAEWSGGTGEPMARNLAGIEYTKERCYYLISLIN